MVFLSNFLPSVIQMHVICCYLFTSFPFLKTLNFSQLQEVGMAVRGMYIIFKVKEKVMFFILYAFVFICKSYLKNRVKHMNTLGKQGSQVRGKHGQLLPLLTYLY